MRRTPCTTEWFFNQPILQNRKQFLRIMRDHPDAELVFLSPYHGLDEADYICLHAPSNGSHMEFYRLIPGWKATEFAKAYFALRS